MGNPSRALVAVLAVLCGLGVQASSASAYPSIVDQPVPGNPADALVRLPPDPIEYDFAEKCVKRPTPGILSLQKWLQRHARGAAWGILRCEDLGTGHKSLHSEGRALDWHLDVSLPADRREARRLIGLLLAPDALGVPQALARRMGLQEIIWDCMYWSAGMAGMGDYRPCFNKHGTKRKRVNRTLAHRDHLHLGMSRAGAERRTSYWTRRAYPVVP